MSDFAKRLRSILSWERASFPLYQPQIARDVLIYSALSSADNGLATMKNIHFETSHSEDRVREVIRKLVSDGWLTIHPHEIDGRSKCIKPTQKSIRLFNEYEKNWIIVKVNPDNET